MKNDWFFDDKRLGLFAEGLTDGTPEVISCAMSLKNLQHPVEVLFLDKPQFEHVVCLLRPYKNGHQYVWKEKNMICWFCPALLKFFKKPPDKIWFKVKGKF